MAEALVTMILLPFFLIVYCAMIVVFPIAIILAMLPRPKERRRRG